MISQPKHGTAQNQTSHQNFNFFLTAVLSNDDQQSMLAKSPSNLTSAAAAEWC